MWADSKRTNCCRFKNIQYLSATSRRSETAYDYEERLNEDKKNIKILDRRFKSISQRS